MSNELTPKQIKAVMALMSQPTFQDAAKSVGVTYMTIRNWLKDPIFNREYKRMQEKAVESALGKIQNFANESVEIIMDIAKDETVNANIRLNAIKTIWDVIMKRRNNDIVDRLDKLESQSQGEEMEMADIG